MRKIIQILLLIFLSYSLNAQDVKVSVEAPSVVAVGEQFRISWTANTRGGEFVAPGFDDFYLLSGPQTSFSQSTQIVNGKVTSTISNTYSYYLQATEEGKFTVQPAKLLLDKKEYSSDPLVIEVVKDSQGTGSQSAGDAGREQNTAEGVSSSDLFVRMLVNKDEIYMGEHVLASLKIYSRVNLSGIQEVKYPDFQSFLKEDIETPPLRNLERENVNGSIYGTGVLQRFLLYPQKKGTITINPAELTVLLQQKSRSNDPFFGDFFSSFSSVPRMIATIPVEIKVKPLPAGGPDAFKGAVGSFTMGTSLSADTVFVNDALTLKITLKGSGNLKLASAPDVELPPDIEVYEPETSSELNVSASGTSGTRTFEYVLIPRYHGNFKIPSLKYVFFDPSSGRYKTLTGGDHSFVVLKGDEEQGATQVYGGVSRENVRFLGRDIRYIDTSKPNFRSLNNILIADNAFLYSFPGLALLFIIMLILRREQIKRNSDIARVRNRKAAGIASKRLKKAAACLNESDTEGFYDELLKALWGYLADKFNIPVSELSIDTVNSTMIRNKYSTDISGELQDVIAKCEYSKYSPDTDISTADDIYKKAEEIIKIIENK
ncbi:MAG: BatD family protein [Bacteroidales bacterium]|nr:BatD family protein [Bacteroidales bacterium]